MFEQIYRKNKRSIQRKQIERRKANIPVDQLQ